MHNMGLCTMSITFLNYMDVDRCFSINVKRIFNDDLFDYQYVKIEPEVCLLSIDCRFL